MSRSYSHGKRKRKGCPTGHCYCRYDFGRKARLKNQRKKDFKFDILPYADYILKR